MRPNEYTKLKFARFRYVGNWSVSHILGQRIGFNDNYLSQPIGSFVKRSSVSTNVRNDCQYKQITLKTKGGGAVLRDIKLGKDIGTKKQYVVSKGQFIMSKIDARNGAFGIVPNDLDGAIVTADFPLFDIETDIINPVYFSLISSTNAFARFAQSCSRGTTNRQRIDINLFLSQQIPLPTLSEQQALVKAYNDKIQQAESLERRAGQIEKEIEEYLLNELGIDRQKKTGNSQNSGFEYLKFVKFKDINEWGYNLMTNHKSLSSLYPTQKVKDICSLGSGGTPSRSIPKYYQGNIPWIKTGEVVNDLILDTEEHISLNAIENSSAKLYPKGSLIIAMYGQGDTRGRTAKMGIDATTNQACAVLYNINNDLVTTDYLWYYFQGRYNDLRSLASGNNQPNLNAGKIKNYDVVIPSLEIQNAIVEHINEQKEQIKELKKQAEKLRKEALEEFEKEIFE